MDSVSKNTFEISYEELRVNYNNLGYYLFRYLKLLFIAIIVAVTYSASPFIPLILLIVIHLVDLIWICAKQPFEM